MYKLLHCSTRAFNGSYNNYNPRELSEYLCIPTQNFNRMSNNYNINIPHTPVVLTMQ